MATWDPNQPRGRRTRVPAPGIFVGVEFGISFSNRGQPHMASLGYTSRRMQERLQRQRRQQEDHVLQEREHYQRPWVADFERPHPSLLMPGTGSNRNEQYSWQSEYLEDQPRRISAQTHNSRERGSSAPPSLSDHSESPTSPVSSMGTYSQFGPLQHTSSMPIGGIQDRLERPLPPLPSQFRLGEDGLPWTTEPWYYESEPESEYVSRVMAEVEQEHRRQEDPQRVRDLGALQQAMMTVDSLPYEEAWIWDSPGEEHQGPRSLGWAVRSEDLRPGMSPRRPPPYVVSQFEQAITRSVGMRPRSSG
ncbi:uncharacterized protein RCO7_01992 [Rhynchosporium graminicola]|uniref:Uncharacterized protein n=1 Tax=Rhynchosporium graminicola TaxID=2792576 RepID=A0A1E1KT93_9HELO|nr:uncharacterized protein RCO7_01992 [Rhynchosporium commune]